MIEGSFTLTPALKAWLKQQTQTLVVDANNKGCHGTIIIWRLETKDNYWSTDFYLTRNVHMLIERGLQLEIDYIDEPLFKRVHINILNKDKCGCGLSFSTTEQ